MTYHRMSCGHVRTPCSAATDIILRIIGAFNQPLLMSSANGMDDGETMNYYWYVCRIVGGSVEDVHITVFLGLTYNDAIDRGER